MWTMFLWPTGQITLSEFMEGAQKDEWVMNLLKLDINATSWVLQNCSKFPWSLTEWVHCIQVFVWGWQRGAVFMPWVLPESPCCDLELELSALFSRLQFCCDFDCWSKGSSPCCMPVVCFGIELMCPSKEIHYSLRTFAVKLSKVYLHSLLLCCCF